MPSRNAPGLGLAFDWDLGEDGWKTGMDANIFWLSVLVGGAVDDVVAAEPGVPVEGDVVILDETHATQPNTVAAYDEGAWHYQAVPAGTVLFSVAAGDHVLFDGSIWSPYAPTPASGSGLAAVDTDADDYTVLAADNNKYIRLTAAGTKTVFIQDNATEALPANGEWHFRNVGAGDTTFDDTDVTINIPVGGSLVVEQGGTVTLKRVAVDEFDLIGVTAAP
jgi:hypothetical protein